MVERLPVVEEMLFSRDRS